MNAGRGAEFRAARRRADARDALNQRRMPWDGLLGAPAMHGMHRSRAKGAVDRRSARNQCMTRMAEPG